MTTLQLHHVFMEFLFLFFTFNTLKCLNQDLDLKYGLAKFTTLTLNGGFILSISQFFCYWPICLFTCFKAVVRQAILTSNIAIKRHFFRQYFVSMLIEILNSWLFQLILKSKSNILTKKYFFCQKNIASSVLLYLFIALLLAKIVRLTRALKWLKLTISLLFSTVQTNTLCDTHFK